MEVLEIETDLLFANWLLTKEERSLVDAVGKYMCERPGRRADVVVRL